MCNLFLAAVQYSQNCYGQIQRGFKKFMENPHYLSVPHFHEHSEAPQRRQTDGEAAEGNSPYTVKHWNLGCLLFIKRHLWAGAAAH